MSRAMLNKRQVIQSTFTLLLFCVTFLAHSHHYVKSDPESLPAFVQHDCPLCQQAIDSPPSSIGINIAITSVFSSATVKITNVAFVLLNYLHPPLRAPPAFL